MQTIVLSLGGSIICPDKPDYFFLRRFKNFVIDRLDFFQFIIVCGGGKTNTYYNQAAQRISNVADRDLDWIGIMATRLNAELVRAMFGTLAFENVVYDPHQTIKTTKIIIAAGFEPGCSTDTDAVILAHHHQAKTIVNLSNITHVYDKDPNQHKDAKKIHHMTWDEFIKMVGTKWSPRMHAPFDPVASVKAQNWGMKVLILDGTNLQNLANAIENKTFEGTTIE